MSIVFDEVYTVVNETFTAEEKEGCAERLACEYENTVAILPSRTKVKEKNTS